MNGKFTEGQKVRLRTDVDTSIYGELACAGNEGWVLRYRKDKFDLPEVLIQWDKNHWTYNGVQDGWTFEDHFEPVESMSQEKDKQQQLDTLLQSFGDGLRTILGGEDVHKAEEKPKDAPSGLRNLLSPAEDKDNPQAEYDEALKIATEQLQDAEGFIVIGVTRQEHPKAERGMLVPFALGYSKTTESELLVGAHLSHVAAGEHQSLTVQAIRALIALDESGEE